MLALPMVPPPDSPLRWCGRNQRNPASVDENNDNEIEYWQRNAVLNDREPNRCVMGALAWRIPATLALVR